MGVKTRRFGFGAVGRARARQHEALRWYPCYTRPRAEKRVAGMLLHRGVEAFLPTVARDRTWADRIKVVDFPLFPSYVFGRFRLSELHRVLSVPGLATVVLFGGRPAPISDHEIENIRRLAAGLSRTSQRPEPQRLQRGQRVVVTDGPFGGVEGVVIQVRGSARVLVGLSTIGQGLAVDVDEAVLQLLPGQTAAAGLP